MNVLSKKILGVIINKWRIDFVQGKEDFGQGVVEFGHGIVNFYQGKINFDQRKTYILIREK